MATVEESRSVTRKHPAAKCEECPLYEREMAVTQQPTKGCKAAIVSRSPGYRDTVANRPFSGPSGQVLDHLLRMNGVDRSEVLVTNVVLCSPPEGKVPPSAIAACAPRLATELDNARTNLFIAAGSEAVNSLIGRGSIDGYRGYAIERNGRKFIATNNPALVLRDDSTFPNLVKDFKRAFNPLPPPRMPGVKLVENPKFAKELLNELNTRVGYVAADIETRGGLSHRATLVSLQLSFEKSNSFVFGEREGLWQDDDFIHNYLRPFFGSTDRQFIWHNGIFDTKILRHGYGVEARVDEDTLLLSWACDERGGVHELEYLMMEEFGWPHYTPPSVMSFKKTGRIVSEAEEKRLRKQYGAGEKYDAAYSKLETNNYIALYKYAGYDAAGTLQLFELLKARAEEDSVFERPYRETLLAAEDVLRTMEMNGMPYDYHRAAEMLEKEVYPELDQIVFDVRKLSGKELLKPSSPQQMAALYYDDLGITHEMRRRPDMGRSVDDSARKEIIDGRFYFKGQHKYTRSGDLIITEAAPDAQKEQNRIQQIAKQHDRFAKLNKQAGTYLTGLIRIAELDEESRIFTSLNRHNTSSGRLSSRGPNLQNVTRTKEGLPDIRGLFYALDGELLVSADYSQAELRAIGALSGDKLLCGYYERDEDLHNATATRFYGENFTSEQRSNSKNMNFGVFYRQSADTFLEKHEIPVDEAQKYIDWVWQTFKGVGTWEKSIETMVHTNRHKNYTFVESPFGHRRRFYLITRENKNAIYREAINFLPQNIAANLTLHACIELLKNVDQKRALLCLTVHDSILARVKESYVDEYSQLCREIMVAQPKEKLGWTLPFKADIGVGKTWATAK